MGEFHNWINRYKIVALKDLSNVSSDEFVYIVFSYSSAEVWSGSLYDGVNLPCTSLQRVYEYK